MTRAAITKRMTALVCCVVLTTVGCGFKGLNSLPLPGAVGRGPGATVYHVKIANVGSLESNSPVLIDDVVVGSVGAMRLDDWHADIDVSIRSDVFVPGNVVATVGQTSLLGSMHVALDAPLGQAPHGRLPPGATIPLASSSSYPSTETTLASISTVVNAGGLGQIGDIVHTLNTALSGREGAARDLITHLDRFVGLFSSQRGDVIESIKALNRLAGTLVAQRDVLSRALRDIPPALDVLNKERPRITTALEKLGEFGDTATAVVNDAGADLVTNLKNLEPTVRSLADVGPDIDATLAYLPLFPFSQNIVDRGIHGDYMNLFIVLDLTNNRFKRTLAAGTRFEDQNAQLVPAPGDIGYDAYYTRNPLGAPIAPPPPTFRDAITVPPPPLPTAPRGPSADPSSTPAPAPGLEGGG